MQVRLNLLNYQKASDAVNGELLSKRLSRGRSVVIARSQEILIDRFAVNQIQPGDVRIVDNGDLEFCRLHGNTQKLAERMNVLLGDPKMSHEESQNYQGVTFTRKLNRNHWVWTFRVGDLGAVAGLLGVKYDNTRLRPYEKGEVRIIANNDDNFARIHGKAKNIADRLNGLLGLPEEFTNETVSYGGVVFTRRYSRSNIIWTFLEENIDLVGKILGLRVDKTILEEVKPDEIRIVAHREEKMQSMFENPERIAKIVNSILGDPNDSTETTVEYQGLVFNRRKSGSRNRVWALSVAGLKRLKAFFVAQGIISNRRFAWPQDVARGEDLSAVEGSNDELILFDSNEERKIGLILFAYGLIQSFRPGINMQVRASATTKHCFDYCVEVEKAGKKIGVVIEHHPGSQDLNVRKIESQFVRLLVMLEDDAVADELIDLYYDPAHQPNNPTVLKLLSRQANFKQRDRYDLQRLVLLELGKNHQAHQYIRTRRIRDLFESFIWPFVCQPSGEFEKGEGYKQFRQTIKRIDKEVEAFDQKHLPQSFSQREAA